MNPLKLFAAALGRRPGRPRPSPAPARPRLGVCRLDDRVTPAVGALGLLDGDFLTVAGDDTANTVVVRQSGGQLTLDGGTFVTPAGTVTSVPASGVAGLLVLAGAGDDRVFVDSSVTVPATIEGGDGNDTLVAGGGPTDLFGGAGDDALFGGAGNDRLLGADGADTLSGGGGNDVAFGGLGTDVFARSTESRRDATGADSVRRSDPARPALPAATPAATPALGAFRQPAELTATLVGDVLTVQGTAGDDVIELTLADGDLALADGTVIQTDAGALASVDASDVRLMVVLGYAGADTLDVSAARAPARVIGGAGADTIAGGSGADSLFGGAGADVITAGAGADRVYAGSGDDAVDLGSGDDVAFTGAGTDAVVGGTGRDRVADPAGDAPASGVETLGAEVMNDGPRGPGRPRGRR